MNSTNSSGMVQGLTLNGGHTLNLNGPAPLSAFQAAVAAVKYTNLADNPTAPLERYITVIANDGLQNSHPAVSMVTIMPTNDPPIIETSSIGQFVTVFVEGGSGVAVVSSDASISDPDSDQLQSLAITLQSIQDQGSEFITMTMDPPSGVIVEQISASQLRVSGLANVGVYSSLLLGSVYINNASEPIVGNRTVRFRATDSDGLSSSDGVTTIEVVRSNDAPRVDTNGPGVGGDFTTIFIEEGPSVLIFSPDLEISDPDSDVLTMATVTIVNRLDSSLERLVVGIVPETTLSSSHDIVTGEVVISGIASVADYVRFLTEISYINTADEPSAEDRLINVRVSDGTSDSVPGRSIVRIQLVNDPPTLYLDSPQRTQFTAVFVENGSPVQLANPRDATIQDPDSSALSHLEVNLMQIANSGQEDIIFNSSLPFEVLTTIADDGLSILYNFTPTVAASPSQFTVLLSSLTYFNTAEEPNTTIPRRVEMRVSDGEAYSPLAATEISIQLIDDNDPMFDPRTYNLTIPEDTPTGVTLLTLTATDADGDAFHFVLLTQLEHFVLSSSGALSLVNELDREDNSSFLLEAALSQPTPGGALFSSRAVVNVQVTDVNDNIPLFSQPVFQFTVAENSPPGSLVGNVSAFDEDIGSNSEILFTVSENVTVPFSVDTISGAITVAAILDRESVPTYQFEVIARDRGIPSLSSMAVVRVILSDVNDMEPMFPFTILTTSVLETHPVGSVVAQVSASDGDLGSNAELTYHITAGNSNSAFAVNSTSGVISVAASLNHSAIPIYNLTVTASDSGEPSLSADTSVVVELLSITSLFPVFDDSFYSGSILEEQPPNGSILTVSARNPFTSVSEGIEYSLEASVAAFFSVDSLDGVIRPVAVFDRETRETYMFSVVAINTSDPALRSTAQVAITVTDFNDHAPSFDQTLYTFAINEEVDVGTTVGQVLASDLLDTGINAQIMSFEINSSLPFMLDRLGLVRTLGRVNREDRAVYTFSVLAIDGGTPALTGTSTLTVTLLDINDNLPIFTSNEFTGSVRENLPAGVLVLTVSAMDADTAPNANIRFSISDSIPFTIDAQSGEIRTSTLLNFEAQNTYQTVVTATDGVNPASSATVLINVTDADDLPPQFEMPLYIGTILEESAPMSFVITVRAVDPDANGSNPILYSIQQEATNQVPFTVDTASGTITTNASLDREQVSQYEFVVSAASLDSFGVFVTGTTLVRVLVLDQNDNAPQFLQQPYAFTLSEDSPPMPIVTFVVSDADAPPSSDLSTFHLSEDFGRFSVDPVSGVLRLNGSLDFESRMTYNFTVIVADTGVPPLTGSAMVSIVVSDVNDNAPMFSQASYPAFVPEDTPLQTVLTTIQASDRDQGANRDITYSLIDPSGFLGINNITGDVYLLRTLDYETVSYFNATVMASDGGSPRLTGTSLVEVVVMDVDDFPVVFPISQYSATLLESAPPGSFVTKVTAVDQDQFQSSLIQYSVIPSTDPFPFTVDSESGDVCTTAYLDYESISFYTFGVAASNTPNQSATATVTVSVIDVNDVMPQFVDEPFTVELEEDAPQNLLLGVFSAVDRDEGIAGFVVDYRIEPSDSVLVINALMASITLVGQLDRETVGAYQFTLYAVDGGLEPLTGTATLTLNVLDINDNPPVFVDRNVTAVLSDADPPGTTAAVFAATDADEGLNAMITYRIQSPTPVPFIIDPDSGLVTNRAELNATLSVPYSLEVVATDSGSPSLSATAALLVFVTDINDRPAFLEDVYQQSVLEGASSGTFLTQVEARDPESHVLTYSLLPSGSPFLIDPLTGSISIIGVLDRETTSSYNLTVLARDSGDPPLTASATLIVQVVDVNDNPPVFVRPFYTLTVPEDATSTEPILVLEATDDDEGTNREITFSLTGDGGRFRVNVTSGEVFVQEPLNFEDTTLHRFFATARDGGSPTSRSDTVTVTVIVSDADDLPPVFQQDLYSAILPEDSPIGMIVVQTQASDDDTGDNGVVRYQLANSTTTGLFSVNETSGSVHLSASLDQEQQDLHVFLVEAYNPHSSRFTSTVTVTVTVTDINDVAPVFNSTLYTFSVPEDTPLGMVVGMVTATDGDSVGPNSELRYNIWNASLPFEVDTFTGEIRLVNPIDREEVERYDFTVTAQDLGTSPLTSSTDVIIFVLDINDNSPLVTANRTDFNYFEEGSALAIAEELTVSDMDTFLLVSASIEVFLDSTHQPDSGDLLIVDLTGIASISLAPESSGQALQLQGNGTPALYTRLLQTLAFSNINGEPVPGPRSVRVSVSDGSFVSPSVVIAVTVALLNDNPPVLFLSEALGQQVNFVTTFTEQGPGVKLVGNDPVLSDVDLNSEVESLNISLLNAVDHGLETLNFSIPENSNIFLSPLSNASSLVLLGPSTHQHFIAVLSTIQYINMADEPSMEPSRLVSFVVSDGLLQSETVTAVVSIETVNDPPTLLLGGTTVDATVLYVE